MNARTHYISLLKASGTDNTLSSTLEETIRKGVLEWMLYREYWSLDDSLDRLAADLDVTKEDISLYVASRTGSKIRVIKKELRLEDAKQMLLEHPDMSIYDISRSVGIADKSNFRKLFKDNVGYTPTIWRKGKGNPCLCRVISIFETGRSHCLSRRKTS